MTIGILSDLAVFNIRTAFSVGMPVVVIVETVVEEPSQIGFEHPSHPSGHSRPHGQAQNRDCENYIWIKGVYRLCILFDFWDIAECNQHLPSHSQIGTLWSFECITLRTLHEVQSLLKRLCFWVSPGLIKLIIENACRTYGQEWFTRDKHAERCNKIQIRLKVICEKLYSDSLPQIIYISKQDTWVVSIRTWNFQMLCSHWNHCVQSLNSNAV